MPATSNYEVVGHVVTLLSKRQPFTRYDAAEWLGLHDRTALRLCQALEQAGLLTVVRDGRKSYYKRAMKLNKI